MSTSESGWKLPAIRIRRWYIAIVVVALAMLGCATSHKDSALAGKAIKIADGDTFTMLLVDRQKVRVRLYGIDCPERNQPYGAVAKKFLADLIGNKEVAVEEMDVDQYGRVVGIVWVGKINVNEELLINGLAWHYTEYDHNPSWALLEREARENRLGLWGDAHPVNPKSWRKK